jgi:putative transposase
MMARLRLGGRDLGDRFEEARMAAFAFIEGFHLPTRRHSALGYLSPIEYGATATAESD